MSDAMILACGLVYFPNMLHSDMKGEGNASFSLHPQDQRVFESEQRASFNATLDSMLPVYQSASLQGEGEHRFQPGHLLTAPSVTHSGKTESSTGAAFDCFVAPGSTLDPTSLLQGTDSFTFAPVQTHSLLASSTTSFRECPPLLAKRPCQSEVSGSALLLSTGGPSDFSSDPTSEPCLLPCCHPVSLPS
jgi:hypothetical protein